MENTCWIVRGQPVQYLFDPETGKTKIGRHVEYPPMAIGSANVLGEDYEPEPAYVAACDAIRFATKQDAVAFTKIMQDAVSHESGYYHKQLTLNFDGVEFTVSEFPANAARGDGKCIRSERIDPDPTPVSLHEMVDSVLDQYRKADFGFRAGRA